MFAGVLGQLERCTVAGLAFLAASYHLTETAHRQAELARRRQQAECQAHNPSKDAREGKSKERQVLEWLAPDMLARASQGGTTDELARPLASGKPTDLSRCRAGVARPVRQAAQTEAPADDLRPIRKTHLSDRSAHGPPCFG